MSDTRTTAEPPTVPGPARTGGTEDRSAVHQRLIRARRARRIRTIGTMWAMRVGVVVLLLGVWEAAHAFEWMNPVFISDPRSVAESLVDMIRSGDLWADGWATLKAAMLGLLIGGSGGIIGGLVLAEFPTFREAVRPIVTLANALPRPALAPIFLVWFGLGIGSKVAVAVSIVFFLLLINTLAGVDGVDSDRAMLSRTLRMSRLQRFRLLQLPTAGPSIIAGLRLGAVYSVLGAVVAEMVASTDGLGLRLVRAANSFDIAGSFAILFVLALLAYALDWVIGQVERRLSWQVRAAD
ncbi:ABC transporter permease [Nocardioides humi]|uniref:ABC transporter permease n=1 Tax=Nocardioides humi TaxID=449461 RepID=A0ABN1ZW55_9ACTN|nr:ABC transporter permease [Nocardioides humi]